MSDGKGFDGLDSFNEQLKQALEHSTDPAWLGEHSPLAMPYFLGSYLWGRPDAETPLGRGQVFQSLLRESADLLARQGEDGAYARRLLDLTFFHPQLMFDILNTLGIARSTYYRHLAKAVQQLAAALLRSVKPALRLESPPRESPHGRDQEIAEGLRLLGEGAAIAITGSSGIGKTTFGAALAAGAAPRPVFWFTLLAGANDQLGSLIFALGYFLHRQGASSLWLQLVADGGRVDEKIVLGLVRHDLAALQRVLPLLCFDEVDVLRPAEIEAHSRMLAFLESLRGLGPLLLISHRRMIEVDREYALQGLAPAVIQELLARLDLPFDAADLDRLHEYTAGNPRLIRLLLSMQQPGERLLEALPRLSSAPTLEFLMGRIWRQLGADERRLLTTLAVFRRFTPSDAWQPLQAALRRLLALNLVQEDGRGGVAVLPALRASIYHLLPPEERDQAHLLAAEVRSARGEYTAAAYHAISGGRAALAVESWYHHREQEIDQGQAAAALAVFGQLSHHQLPEEQRALLVVLRSELRMLVGEYDAIREDIRALPPADDQALTARAQLMLGNVSLKYSQLGQALGEYQAGLGSAAILLERVIAEFHVKLGMIYERQRDLGGAWREARLALYEAENLQGYVLVASGDYAAARDHYLAALAIAEELPYAEGAARTCDNLAQLLARQAAYDEARHFWERAFAYYDNSGNLSRLARIKANQAALYSNLGQSLAAIESAEGALAVYTRLGESHGKAHAAHNLADAYLKEGDLDQAARHALLALEENQPGIRPYSLLTLGEVRFAQGRFADAEEFCRQAIAAGELRRDRRIAAYASRQLGEVLVAQGRPPEAQAAFAQALDGFGQLGLAREVAQTEALLGLTPGHERSAGAE